MVDVAGQVGTERYYASRPAGGAVPMADVLILTDEHQQITGTIQKKKNNKENRHTVAAAFELSSAGPTTRSGVKWKSGGRSLGHMIVSQSHGWRGGREPEQSEPALAGTAPLWFYFLNSRGLT